VLSIKVNNPKGLTKEDVNHLIKALEDRLLFLRKVIESDRRRDGDYDEIEEIADLLEKLKPTDETQ